MYKLLLFCIFATSLICKAAEAAPPPCWFWQTNATGYELQTVPESKFQWLRHTTPEHSFVVSWWCRKPYSWSHVSFFGFKDQLDDNFMQVIEQTVGNVDAANTLWNERITCPGDVTSPGCERYAPLATVADLIRDATRPPPIIWNVRDNPTNNSRPTFSVNPTTGVRSTTATANSRVSDVDIIGTSEVENRCKCVERAVVESGGTYCSVSGNSNVATAIMTDVIAPNQAALCVEQL